MTWLGLEGVSRLLGEKSDKHFFIIVVCVDEEFKTYLGFSRDIMGDDGKPGCSIGWWSALEEDISRRREELASFDPAREGVCSIVAAAGRDFGTRFLGVDEIARRALDGGISLISGNNGGPCDWEANCGRPPYTSFFLLPRGVAITCTL